MKLNLEVYVEKEGVPFREVFTLAEAPLDELNAQKLQPVEFYWQSSEEPVTGEIRNCIRIWTVAQFSSEEEKQQLIKDGRIGRTKIN